MTLDLKTVTRPEGRAARLLAGIALGAALIANAPLVEAATPKDKESAISNEDLFKT